MRDRTTLVAVGAAALLAASPAPAAARTPACGTRPVIVKHLGAEYREQPVALGLTDSGAVVEILVSADGETWTLLFTLPSGVSCLVAAGTDWQTAPMPQPGEES